MRVLSDRAAPDSAWSELLVEGAPDWVPAKETASTWGASACRHFKIWRRVTPDEVVRLCMEVPQVVRQWDRSAPGHR